MLKSKELIFILYSIALSWTHVRTTCMAITASSLYGGLPSGLCFEVSVTTLKQLIVHTQTNITGFTFNFNDGTSESYIEKSGIMTNYIVLI